MQQLLGPIIGITLVLMSVFLPAAFLPGLTGRMYAQFALVIAATALISAVNAVTLKPTQAALWLRPAKPPEQRNIFARGFNKVYGCAEAGYMWIIRHLTAYSGVTVVIGLLIIAGGDLWHCADSDRLPAARRSGLFHRRRAIAGRCFARSAPKRR